MFRRAPIGTTESTTTETTTEPVPEIDPARAEEYAELVRDNADLWKWICASADELRVETKGAYIVLVMGTKEECKTIGDAFWKLDI